MPASDFVVVQSTLALGRLEGLLDLPASSSHMIVEAHKAIRRMAALRSRSLYRVEALDIHTTVAAREAHDRRDSAIASVSIY